MIAALENHKTAPGVHLVHETMGIVNPARPAAGKGVPQRLRLANAAKGIALDVLDKLVDAGEFLAVRAAPMQVILPRAAGEANHP